SSRQRRPSRQSTPPIPRLTRATGNGEGEGIKARASKPRWVASFAQSHVLDGVHDSNFAVLVAISVEVARIPFNCAGFDDSVVVFAVVIPAEPQYDIPRGKWEFLHRKLLARYFNNVDCHLCSRPRYLHKHQ